VSIQSQQGFLSALRPTSMSTPGDSLSVHQDTVEDPVVVLAQILSPHVDKIPCRMIRTISKIIFISCHSFENENLMRSEMSPNALMF